MLKRQYDKIKAGDANFAGTTQRKRKKTYLSSKVGWGRLLFYCVIVKRNTKFSGILLISVKHIN